MAILGAAFSIGRSALAAYQAAIAITGQNIANLGNADYARQSGRLTPLVGGPVSGGIAPGAGVRLSALQRHLDEALEAQLRLAVSNRSGAEVVYRGLSQVEGLYNELTDQDLSTNLNEFFGAMAGLETNPTESVNRNLVLAGADRMIQAFRRQRSGLLRQVSDLNAQVSSAADRASAIAAEIASLNEQVATADARGSGGASPLRDRRDGLLRELSELINIQVREQDNGAINVYVNSEPLVEFDRSRGLTTERVLENGLEVASVRFADNRGAIVPLSGQIAGISDVRDTHVRAQLERLDQLARGLIYEVNRVHASGRGLVGYASVTGTYAAADTSAALNSPQANLPFPVSNGTFIVHVQDTTNGQEITRQIEVDLDGVGSETSLDSLAAALSNVPGLNASVTSDRRLKIDAAAGFEVSFSEDSSGALAGLGVATFFDGADATTIAVRDQVRQDPRLIAASLSGAAGDGDNAGKLATLGGQLSGLLNNQSIQDFHASTVDNLAVAASAALTDAEASDAIYSSLYAQREAISGVSLDEEAINLTKFERAYQGAARFISVLDSLSDEVLALVR